MSDLLSGHMAFVLLSFKTDSPLASACPQVRPVLLSPSLKHLMTLTGGDIYL